MPKRKLRFLIGLNAVCELGSGQKDSRRHSPSHYSSKTIKRGLPRGTALNSCTNQRATPRNRVPCRSKIISLQCRDGQCRGGTNKRNSLCPWRRPWADLQTLWDIPKSHPEAISPGVTIPFVRRNKDRLLNPASRQFAIVHDAGFIRQTRCPSRRRTCQTPQISL
jgi:hypothetical protein